MAREDLNREVLKEYLDDMEGEIRRCKSIIDDLLYFSKKETGGFVEADINSIVSRTIDLISKGKRQHRIRIITDLHPLPRVRTNPERFRQVVVNVLKNAIEALEGREDGTVWISTSFRDNMVVVRIADNGSGIPKKDLPKVFEPFYTTKPVGRGTGLGLSVSYCIMQDLKGEIRIESVEGRGTIVYLTLPLQP